MEEDQGENQKLSRRVTQRRLTGRPLDPQCGRLKAASQGRAQIQGEIKSLTQGTQVDHSQVESQRATEEG